MSEYWVSKKKYFCKYCEIYIADDVPSRQHHENGLRHKGNVERYIRGIYKAGEKKKKDLEEEKRDMARVEQAARAAFAQDVSSGHAKASSTPAPSVPSGSRKPATKPSNPFANYSTAAQLGYTDPDAEKLEIRKSQGLVGEWQIIEATATGPPEEDIKLDISPGVDSVVTGTTEGSTKRSADPLPDDDTRTFKLRKKSAAVGLGDIYDPGIIPIKLKKKEIISPPEASTSTSVSSASTSEAPKWTAISLKPRDSTVLSSTTSSSVPKAEETSGSLSQSSSEKTPTITSRWTKVQWGEPIKEEGTADSFSEQLSRNVPTDSTLTEPTIKTEEDVSLSTKAESFDSTIPSEPEPPTTALFKKRKTPAGAGRGRRQI